MIIGLTGGIASGKTVCSGWFAGQGVPVVDADQVAREVVQPGKAAYSAIVRYFGEAVLQPNGQLNRRALREQVFSDPAAREALNAITHPAIRTRSQELLDGFSNAHEVVIYSVPLLLENRLELQCDSVVVIDVPVVVQLQRGSARDHSQREQIARIIASQIPREQRLSKANYVIDNSGSLAGTYAQCERIYYHWQSLSIF